MKPKRFIICPEPEEMHYTCLKCGGHAIYISLLHIWEREVLICRNCGESDDAYYGIAETKTGKRLLNKDFRGTI
jgi:transcription elongation factor Elf1